jgi:hypothetical protein
MLSHIARAHVLLVASHFARWKAAHRSRRAVRCMHHVTCHVISRRRRLACMRYAPHPENPHTKPPVKDPSGMTSLRCLRMMLQGDDADVERVGASHGEQADETTGASVSRGCAGTGAVEVDYCMLEAARPYFPPILPSELLPGTCQARTSR